MSSTHSETSLRTGWAVSAVTVRPERTGTSTGRDPWLSARATLLSIGLCMAGPAWVQAGAGIGSTAPADRAAGPTVDTTATGPDGLTQLELTVALHQLQQAVAASDPRRIEPLLSFPLQVTQGQHSSRWSRAKFRSNQRLLFNDKVRRAIAQQSADSLFRNSRGAMVGDGEVWLSGVCTNPSCSQRKVQVVTVNAD